MSRESLDQEHWNSFVTQNSGSFLQSYEWGEFQRSLGRTIYRVRGEEWQALVVKHELPFGKSYLYCPRGPVLESGIWNLESGKEALHVLVQKIKGVAKEERAVFFRIDPESQIPNSKFQILNSLGFRKAPKEVQPKRTILIDLAKSEEELLKEMHPKTRYNIRVAQRHGVKITNLKSQITNNPQILNRKSQAHFEEFWLLLQETAKRDGFRTHPKEYYQKQLDSNLWQNYNGRGKNAKGFANELFVAEYNEKIIAGAVGNFFGKRATYLHGASDYSQRNLMAPYLLHWEVMKEAKRCGFSEYDFWGVDEKKWPGITRFKKGFGGREVEYIGAYDIAVSPLWYAAYTLSKNFL